MPTHYRVLLVAVTVRGVRVVSLPQSSSSPIIETVAGYVPIVSPFYFCFFFFFFFFFFIFLLLRVKARRASMQHVSAWLGSYFSETGKVLLKEGTLFAGSGVDLVSSAIGRLLSVGDPARQQQRLKRRGKVNVAQAIVQGPAAPEFGKQTAHLQLSSDEFVSLAHRIVHPTSADGLDVQAGAATGSGAVSALLADLTPRTEHATSGLRIVVGEMVARMRSETLRMLRLAKLLVVLCVSLLKVALLFSIPPLRRFLSTDSEIQSAAPGPFLSDVLTDISGTDMDLIHLHEKVTTGLFEDLYNNCLLLADDIGRGIPLLTSFRLRPLYALLRQSILRFAPANLIRDGMAHLDRSTVKEMVLREGYPYEYFEVVTVDGYVLSLERIPNRSSASAIYFQHGVLDSSYCWIASGGAMSFAFRAHDLGYDVWMGSVRGTGLRRHVRQDLSQHEYWSFNINHHAFFDVRAFMEKIESVKSLELQRHWDKRRQQEASSGAASAVPRSSSSSISSNAGLAVDGDRVGILAGPSLAAGQRVARSRSQAWVDALLRETNNELPRSVVENPRRRRRGGRPVPSIFCVAHSMGAAAVLMYVVQSRLAALPHRLSGCVLLSPAGYHPHIPLFCKLFGPIVDVATHFINAFRFPSDSWRVVAAKLIQDVRNHPGTRMLMNVMTARFLLGGDADRSAITSIHNLTWNSYNGTSVGVYRHFRQLARDGKFQCFDYGSRRNIIEYGSTRPLDILSNFHVVDIPVAFVSSIRDTLIPPECVVAQFETLRKYHPEASFLRVFEKAGHIDFTLGADDDVVDYVFSTLAKFQQESAPAAVALPST